MPKPPFPVISKATKRAQLANSSRPEKQWPNKAMQEDVEKGSFVAVEPNVSPPTGGTSSTSQEGAGGLGEVARRNEKGAGTVHHIDEITWTKVPGEVEEKGKENRLPNEILQKDFPEILKRLHTFMNEVPIDAVSRKDLKRLKNLNRRLTDYLKKGQGSVVSGTSNVSSDQRGDQRLQTGERNNQTIVCEGTFDQGTFNLVDLVELSRTPVNAQLNDRLKSLKAIAGNVFLVMKNGHPSPLLLKLWRQILFRVSDLHDKGIAHGHLNPQSILISQARSSISKGESPKGINLCATPIFDASHEQRKDSSILNPSAESADIYSLGEIFFYSINGRSPSKDELKMVKNKRDSSLVGCPEADDLISSMLIENPESRPKAIKLLDHLVFWKSEKRVSFFRDTSERASRDPRYPDVLSTALEGITVDHIVGKGNENYKVETWDQMIDKEIINYVEKRKWTYVFGSVRDLVRFIRNTKVHYGELPRYIKNLIGSLHQAFDRYFTKKFPMLLIEVYKAVSKCYKNEEYFCRYFGGDLCIVN